MTPDELLIGSTLFFAFCCGFLYWCLQLQYAETCDMKLDNERLRKEVLQYREISVEREEHYRAIGDFINTVDAASRKIIETYNKNYHHENT